MNPSKPLPPLGTLWRDVTPEDRQRMPVGTVLGVPLGSSSASRWTRTVDGQWLTRYDCIMWDVDVDGDRPILSYPPGTDAYLSDAEAAAVDGLARSMAEADRAQVALSTAEAERDEARAEVARLRARLAALDLPTYPCASYEEPGASVCAPRGWEWTGDWYPSGAVTTEGVPVWRRAVRRVTK